MPIGTEVDRIYVSLGADLSGLQSGLRQAARDLETAFNGPVGNATNVLDAAVQSTFSNLSQSLTGAAETGKISFTAMVDSILGDLQRLAVNRFIKQPLGNIVSGLVDGLFSFGGGRAGGGAVSPRQSYLVGERGPELFVPNVSGRIQTTATAAPAAPIVVNFNFPPGADAASFQRAEGQISAMIARAASRGQRNF